VRFSLRDLASSCQPGGRRDPASERQRLDDFNSSEKRCQEIDRDASLASKSHASERITFGWLATCMQKIV